MKSLNRLGIGSFAILGAFGLLTSCTSIQDHGILEGLQDGQPEQPIVEGYFEFSGPDPKWAGPVAFVVHVKTNDGKTTVETYPDIQAVGESPQEPVLSARAPASASAAQSADSTVAAASAVAAPDVVSTITISSGQARARLAEIAEVASNDTTTPSGCLYPVRMRLVRQDGSLIEKQGCRSAQGWAGAMSRTVGYFLGG